MKNILSRSLVVSCLMAVATSVTTFGQETIIIHDWQFNDAAGTAVFNDALNSGTQAGADTEDWLGTTTDGSGSWNVAGTTENRYSGYWLHASQLPVTADKLVLEWAYSSWDWSLTEQKSPNIGFGFISPSGNGAVTILRNGTSLRTRDTITTAVVNFGTDTYNSAAIPSEKIPIDQGTGLELPGAPGLDAGDTLNFRYTVDFTGETATYAVDYAINGGAYYAIYSGEWPHGNIDQIRLQAANPDANCVIRIDYLKVTGTNVEFQELPGSPWKDVYPLINGAARDTGIGWIYDDLYPYVYHYNAVTWMYMVPDATTLDSVYGYDYNGAYWYWTSDTYGGWYFNFTNPDSGNLGWSTWLP